MTSACGFSASEDDGEDEVDRIVVGADGSAGSANAMRWAARIAARHEAEVVVMTGFVPARGRARS